MTYQRYFAIDFTNILTYLAIVVNSRGAYDYVVNPLNSLINLSLETHYDNVTWNDSDPKPTWATLMANAQAAFDWGIATNNISFDPGPWFTRIDTAVSEIPLPAQITDIAGLEDELSGKASFSHAHTADDISDATTIGKSVLKASTAEAARDAISAGTSSFSPTSGTHISDAAINAATNASTSLKTDYALLDGLLGVAGGLNAGNAAQNDLAAKYNSLAAKYNDLSTKFNAVLDSLEANGMRSSS